MGWDEVAGPPLGELIEAEACLPPSYFQGAYSERGFSWSDTDSPRKKAELGSWAVTLEYMCVCVCVCVCVLRLTALSTRGTLRPKRGRPCAGRVLGAPELGPGLGRGPVDPGATGRPCLYGSPETVNWGAVSTGPGLGPSLPTWLPRREKQGKGSHLLLP